MLRGTLLPKSNRESFVDQIELIDPNDGSLWDLTGFTAKVRLQATYPSYSQPDYTPYFNYNALWPPNMLDATTENGGIVIIGNQAFEFTFSESQKASLCSGQYKLSATVTRNSRTLQLFQFDIPILAGGVGQ